MGNGCPARRPLDSPAARGGPGDSAEGCVEDQRFGENHFSKQASFQCMGHRTLGTPSDPFTSSLMVQPMDMEVFVISVALW